ncbi:MAG: hypothetical protein HQL32_09465 [Planctomycetes bacterium]|nr:hypothetical protein [Planctomycetota bacterium]
MKILLLLLLLVVSANATEQEQDILIYKGRRYWTHKMPSLEKCFPKIKWPQFALMSTANYDGYRASWGIFDNKLYLIGIVAQIGDRGKYNINEEIEPSIKVPLLAKEWSGSLNLTPNSDYYEVLKRSPLTIKYTKKIKLEFSNGIITNATPVHEIETR